MAPLTHWRARGSAHPLTLLSPPRVIRSAIWEVKLAPFLFPTNAAADPTLTTAIVGVLIYRPSLSSNFFRTPHIIAIGYTIFGMLMAAYLWIFMSRENTRRARVLGEQAGKGGEAQREVVGEGGRREGDKFVGYVYQI